MTKPKGLTKKQLALLSLIWPCPVGEGLMLADACLILGITVQAGLSRLRNFKKKFPYEFDLLKGAKKINKKHREQLIWGATFGGSLNKMYDIYGTEIDDLIMEKF